MAHIVPLTSWKHSGELAFFMFREGELRVECIGEYIGMYMGLGFQKIRACLRMPRRCSELDLGQAKQWKLLVNAPLVSTR